MRDLLPIFVNLAGRRVVLVGGGAVAASKLATLRGTGADVLVVAPEVHADIDRAGVAIVRRRFVASDLDGAWLVVAAATPPVNRQVADAAEARHVFVNAVDDPANASAFLSGVVRRNGVTLAISTSGDAPGLTALLREAIDHLLPRELGEWVEQSRRQRAGWKRDRIPLAERRPLLLEALNRLYSAGEADGPKARSSAVEVARRRAKSPSSAPASKMLPPGHVSLVGAGPGDPGLLTREALARLRAADLVLYDALVSDRVVRLARRAQRFFVGKRAGRHTLSQKDIHAVMIRASRRGRRVVRLKGGDPFVFGRGGEEAIALLNAGVSFDVVPGVTSAVSAPALAGIPVTHRGVASALLVASGHDERAFAEIVNRLDPEGVTIVVLMGLKRRAALGTILIDKGWPPSTPAALIAEASLPRQQVWRGALADLAEGRAVVESDGPAMIVVGEVAALELTASAERKPESEVQGSLRGSGF
jgi:uroporphyrin-III C-methyltransferase/precorrin-2 dehydrogenase/sirohydrochlorin ferrochelatase